jgi:molecular chaperone DnaK (HSP70)
MDREDIDEIILVGGGTRMPTVRENLRLFFRGKEPNSTVNPDEVVAAGAAIQGYIIANQSDPFSENVVLLDVIPLSLGVEIIGGIMDVIIPRNSVIPIKRKRKYTTDSDYQTEVEIQVFEGERKMSKDNFCIGNFILQGIESAPRGVARIEVTFSVDINGIISVTAEDLDNNQNKNNIIISGNKNRLSPQKIKKLVEEAKDMEIRDKLSRQKKQSYYRIEDLCNNVITNIKNDEFKLKDDDKKIILNDVNKVLQWLESKHFIDHDKKDYFDKLDRLNKKYATLILKITHETDNVKAGNKGLDGIEATSVFSNDDDDDDDVYEKIENDELGFGFDSQVNEELKKEIKQLRELVVEMCYNIFDVVSSDSLKLIDNDREELKDYINDTLLWVHVEEKISKSQYKSKIEEINKFCNNILEKYNDDNIFDDNSMVVNTKRDELEQLCYALKSSIVSNLFSIKEDKIKELDDKINDIFDWLIDIDIKLKKSELNNNTNFTITQNDYQIKLDELNNLCENLYNTIINLDSSALKKDIIQDDEILIVDDNNIDSNMGTSIFNLQI